MRRGTIDPPTMDELRCLNSWPADTVGYNQEEQLISHMLELCNKHGFGRMGQLMSAIEEIWRDPDKVQVWEDFRKERMELLAQDKARMET